MKKTMILAVTAMLMTPVAAMAERDGATLYNTKCMACHMTGAAGAPIFGNAEQWGPRAAKGIDALLVSATNGLNAMPPKGTCMDCTESELKGAIQYMLDNSK
ncbi:Cytochrome C oxidase, cbb3-type, subunit III [Amphritea atlantica]|uniref:Cytochrome C oxidase, cbb3-type, subunit III n=1 Tax=Amphritea atlantica TaxID=355243 RepID=A0A1H9EV37_9GAMM|nr:c-type cytochrome [Amphritea atlantica]SEQ29502.1 Cytochrome C oxidase, cbb3-type, subunit III [Amphritea atlantica]